MSIDFDQFFHDLWGYDPYPWQSALSRRVLEKGWPEVLDVPTGAGKTAVLDIALHHLIVDGGATAPRRIVLVVDRRVIVDQVAERAEHIRAAIENEGTPTLREAHDALRRLVGDGHGHRPPILECPVLRGGTLRDDAWARYPHQPVLAASTVDQVGSRLLFRGYGARPSAWPIHAGLMGCDTLFLLDEVHLARPFADLLKQLEKIRGPVSDVPRRTGTAELSATPGASADEVDRFGISGADREHPRLVRVLNASKPATLETVTVRARTPEPSKREALASRAAEHALQMVAEGRQAVAIVVNRVDTARRAWKALGSAAGFDRELLTGRMRPIDQKEVLDRIRERLKVGRDADPEARPLIVVSTQTMEAGADFDFDGLVTECASLDALRQRFGRLDRAGKIADRLPDKEARAVVLARSDVDDDDPVYGKALRATWTWLGDLGDDVDFGIAALRPHLDALLPARLTEMLAPERDRAVVLPTYLEQWAQTSPAPQADPDVSIFLHGIPKDARIVSDVRVVWRRDLTEADLMKAMGGAEAEREALATITERVSVAPPGSLEALSLPVWTFRAWLGRDEQEEPATDELTDVVGAVAPDTEAGTSVPVLVWGGLRESEVVPAGKVRPGQTVVVPASLGGLGTHGTFDPEADGPIEDLGDITQLLQRGRPTLRLDERVYPFLAAHLEAIRKEAADQAFDVRGEVRTLVGAMKAESPENASERFLEILAEMPGAPRVIESEETWWKKGDDEKARTWTVWAVVGPVRRQRSREDIAIEPELVSDESDGESFIGQDSMLLRPHCEEVSFLAASFAEHLNLPTHLRATLEWAGLLHDVGKVDPRFLAWLHGGDLVSARHAEPIAKSRFPAQDAKARARARRLAGYPMGQRHEMVSLEMIESSAELKAAVEAGGADWELLLYLVASHHGWGRPFAPVVEGNGEGAAVQWTVRDIRLEGTTDHHRDRVGSGVARRFFALGRRYGWHELAYLEAILRLADHRISERDDER